MIRFPLDGLKVVDFSQGLAGPHAGLLLAQNGADVVKIEPTGKGEWARMLGRHYGEHSAYSIYYNRGKRSLSIDLKNEKARQIILDMALKADVLIEAFRPGIMKRYGLAYDQLVQKNPKLVYLSVTGFGQDSAYAQLPATDSIAQGFSGMMSLNRDPHGHPQRFPMVVIDVVTGLYGYQAIASALLNRYRNGAAGTYIDCSLLQSATALLATPFIEHHFQGGYPELMYFPLGILKTKDSWISISVNRDEHFVAFCDAIDRKEIATDPKYLSRAGRLQHRDELMAIISEAFEKRTTQEWIERLNKLGILNGDVRSFPEVLNDPEMKRLGYLDWISQKSLDFEVPIMQMPGIACPGVGDPRRTSPLVGEHSRQVLLDHGLAAPEIDEMVRAGVVKCAE